MKNNNLSELIKNYLEFKKDLENLKENVNAKVYLIHKKDLKQFLEICNNYKNKSINDLNKELLNKNINIKNKNIKLISNFSEIEDTELELVDKKFVTNLNYNEENIKNKELILIKRPGNIKEIIFRHNKKLKVIKNSILQFTESPLELDNSFNNKNISIENEILKNNQTNSNIKPKNDNNVNKKSNTKENEFLEIFNFYKNIDKILKRQKKFLQLIKGPLKFGTQTSYFILNKKYFNKLIKIFEVDSFYENEELELGFSQIINPNHLGQEELKEINERYTKRILELQKEKSFPVELIPIENKYKYPKDFIFMEDFFFEFLNDDIKKKYKYEMILGNNLLFIRDNVNNKIVYVYSANEDKFSIEAIFIFKNETNLKKEIESEFKKVVNISQYYKNKNFSSSIIEEPQRVFDEYDNYIGDIIIVNSQKNIDENNLVDKSNNKNDSKQNNKDISHNNKNSVEENKNKIEAKQADPQLLFHKYVEALFICIFKIENLRQNFPKKNNDMNSIAIIIYNFMKNKEINLNDIKKIENKIKELEKDISELNFEKLLNFILDKLHEELNNKKIINKEKPKDDNDEKISYDNFKKFYFEQNDSIIQKTFFGVKETNILYNCCQLTKYSFEICKYLSFENANQKNDIQSLVDEWGNTPTQGNKYCDMCLIDTDTRIQNKIYDYPEILIIIINNNKNIVKIDIKIKLNTKYEYQLINFISDTKNENNDFNVIYKEENDWRIYQNNNMNNNNIVNDLSNHIPYVIFYGKINKSTTDKISNKSNVTDVFGSSFQSEDNNNFLNNFRNQNNQNNMISFNNNNFYNFIPNYNLYQN